MLCMKYVKIWGLLNWVFSVCGEIVSEQTQTQRGFSSISVSLGLRDLIRPERLVKGSFKFTQVNLITHTLTQRHRDVHTKTPTHTYIRTHTPLHKDIRTCIQTHTHKRHIQRHTHTHRHTHRLSVLATVSSVPFGLRRVASSFISSILNLSVSVTCVLSVWRHLCPCLSFFWYNFFCCAFPLTTSYIWGKLLNHLS